jgi:hypothetical protein
MIVQYAVLTCQVKFVQYGDKVSESSHSTACKANESVLELSHIESDSPMAFPPHHHDDVSVSQSKAPSPTCVGAFHADVRQARHDGAPFNLKFN